MQPRYPLLPASLRCLPFIAALGCALTAAAQTVIVPQSITCTVEPISTSTTPVTNLTLGINANTGTNTTFPLPQQQLQHGHRLRERPGRR